MNRYESVILVNPTLQEKELEGVKTKVFNLLKNNDAKLHFDEKEYEFLLKKTAYLVKENSRAFYFVFGFDANPSFIAELERNFRIDENIIKFMVIRLEENEVSSTKFAEDSKEERKPREYSRKRKSEETEAETTEEVKTEVVEEAKAEEKTEETKIEE